MPTPPDVLFHKHLINNVTRSERKMRGARESVQKLKISEKESRRWGHCREESPFLAAFIQVSGKIYGRPHGYCVTPCQMDARSSAVFVRVPF